MVKEAWTSALRRFQELGHSLHSVSLPATKIALSAYYVLAPAEASSNLAKYDSVRFGTKSTGRGDTDNVLFAATRGAGLGSEVKKRILLGSYSLSAAAIDNYFIKAQRIRRLVQKDFNNIFELKHPLLEPIKQGARSGPPRSQVDIVITPTAQSLPPSLASIKTGLSSYSDDVLTVPASLAGLPAASVPFRASDNSSVGLQVLAQYGDDDLVLEAAKIMEGFDG